MFDRFISKAITIIKIFLIVLILFMVYRTINLFAYSNFNNISNIFKGFSTGFKFDTIVITYFLSIILVFSLPFVFLKNQSWYDKIYYHLSFTVLQLSIFITVFLIVTDFYYYRFFHNHFDNMFFGIFEDDTKAVLASVFRDYPIFWILLFFTLAFWLIWKLNQKLLRKDTVLKINNVYIKALLFVLFLGLFSLGMRGSLGTFPIGKDDMIVCNDNSINDLTPNAIFYLKETISDRKKFKISNDIKAVLNKYRFNNPEEAITLINNCGADSAIKCLINKTPDSEFLKNNPPNVIFILMESFSNQILSLHSNKLNLMGELENQLKHCLVFRNFTSSSNGTIGSFESLIVNTPTVPISQSQYSAISLGSATALPFKKNNYENLFITGSKLNWRNLGPWAGRQFFDEIEGRETLIEEVEGAQEGTWGVFDEFLFQRMFNRLSEESKNNSPVYIFGFTVSNHTPYEVPDTYNPLPLELSDSLKSALKESEKYAWECFRNYQYACHYLGMFIKKIRESEFADNTIIAVTGDHNCRNLFEYPDSELLAHYSVPFIMYVPDKYLSNSTIDTKRFGSHKDIFPTLYNISLPSTEYVNSGNNLLTSDTSTYFFGVNNYTLGFDKYGAKSIDNNIGFQWVENTSFLKPAENSKNLEKLDKMVRAHSFCMDYYVRSFMVDK